MNKRSPEEILHALEHPSDEEVAARVESMTDDEVKASLEKHGIDIKELDAKAEALFETIARLLRRTT